MNHAPGKNIWILPRGPKGLEPGFIKTAGDKPSLALAAVGPERLCQRAPGSVLSRTVTPRVSGGLPPTGSPGTRCAGGNPARVPEAEYPPVTRSATRDANQALTEGTTHPAPPELPDAPCRGTGSLERGNFPDSQQLNHYSPHFSEKTQVGNQCLWRGLVQSLTATSCHCSGHRDTLAGTGVVFPTEARDASYLWFSSCANADPSSVTEQRTGLRDQEVRQVPETTRFSYDNSRKARMWGKNKYKYTW